MQKRGIKSVFAAVKRLFCLFFSVSHFFSLYIQAMEYVQLGQNTGLKVSRISLGAMTFGTAKWSEWVLEEEESLELIKEAWDAGINFWDTANCYSSGKSEEVIGKAIKKFNIPRGRLVVATKVFFPVFEEDPSLNFFEMDSKTDPRLINNGGLSRKHIFDSVHASLRRLQLDYIDILYIHRFDPDTPMEETMEALHDLVKQGKVRYLGASAMHAWKFVRLNAIAEKNGWTQFVVMQDSYSLLYREEEREMIPYLQHAGIAQVPYSPIQRGVLARPVTQSSVRATSDFGVKRRYPDGKMSETDMEIVHRVEEVAKKRGVAMAQIALAWVLSKSHVSSAIVGMNKSARIKEAIDALQIKLTDEEIKYLEEPYVPRAIYGY
ncbi:voltage-gated potassium channel subunit beta-2 [Gongronella butleri]|nr:voltage-gated potassium channel subunit beta-2 [Gongronella butleri]